MRSFFKKPAWATTDNEPSAPEFYRRSEQTYNDILKAHRQQRHEQAAKSALKVSAEPRIPTDAPSKRRRLSEPDDDESREEASKTNNEPESPSSPTGRLQETSRVDVAEVHTGVNSPEEGFPAIDGQERKNLPEIKAVDAVRLHRESFSSPILPTNSSNRHVINNKKESLSAKENAHRPPNLTVARDGDTRGDYSVEKNAVKQEEDPAIEILVTSAIENTRPLVVYRRMSQRFRDVRLAWCERQGFDNRMTSSVYLTWNKRRLFDVTTCRSLDYSALASLSNSLDPEDDGPLRVHVEAVTDELLRSQAEQLTRNRAPDEDEYDEPEEEKQHPFHIILKSQDRGDMRVKVLPQTSVSQVITNYKNKRKIPPDSTVSLSFDGDLLDPASQLKDHDMADLDLVDVFVR
ncbi:hypothetical protein UA08_00002 [Talaromyces atroroseus]|uniref:Ubiquitin-like domain-containing protein n=1 Tax=Talaromyces atroroseus TaxID=1441469 RepID=A0A225B882_TALAT|nr:hypothetical protein UA08_00002 [Talaromyces atroroseus]OKL64299.1 hypothetical protein UA08_00002 [Talaromyces atroroseus]